MSLLQSVFYINGIIGLFFELLWLSKWRESRKKPQPHPHSWKIQTVTSAGGMQVGLHRSIYRKNTGFGDEIIIIGAVNHKNENFETEMIELRARAETRRDFLNSLLGTSK